MNKVSTISLALSFTMFAACAHHAAPSTEVVPAATPTSAAGATSEEKPSLHQTFLILDTHLDTPASFVGAHPYDITARHDYARDGSQVDLPRMNEGGLDGGFWVIFTPQGPLTKEAYADVRDTAILRSLSIHDMVSGHPDIFEFATTAEDAVRINAAGKKVVFQSIENSYPLGEDLSLLETFYKLGVRMVGPVHSATNQFADSSTGEAKWKGLSPLGKELVKEANRLGMVLDASHASDEVLSQMIDLSETPIILSHSGANDVYDHPRNVPDALLVKLAKSGGVIQMNALGRYLMDFQDDPDRNAALGALRQKWGDTNALPADRYEAYLDELEAVNAAHPGQMATYEQFMEQMLHTLKLIGPDHVGMGADWDGGGGVAGMEDITHLPQVTERLLAEGYSESDIQKIWSGNLLRVVKAAADHTPKSK